MPGHEAGEIVLEEDEVGGVFQQLRVGVQLERLLADGRLDALGGLGVVAVFPQDAAGGLGVEPVEAAAPLQVALAVRGIARARRLPALEVLGARGEAHGLRGVGGEACQHGAHAPRVEQFLGLALVAVGIFGVGGVEGGDSRVEALLVRDHAVLRASQSRIARPVPKSQGRSFSGGMRRNSASSSFKTISPSATT